MQPRAFEILQTLGYTIYVRNELIQQKKTVPQVAHITLSTQVHNEPVSIEKVKQHALHISQKEKDNVPLKDDSKQWPIFEIGIFGYIGEVLIIFDMPDVPMRKQVVPLIEKMLVKAGVPKTQPIKNIFRWPMFPERNIDQSENIAKKSLSALVHKLYKEYSWKWLLLMGDTATEYTIGIESETGQQHQYLGMRTLISMDISQLIQHPQSRKTAWSHIELLRMEYKNSVH